MLLLVSCPFNAKPDAIDQVTLGDQPVNAIDLLATLVTAFLLVKILKFYFKFYTVNLC